MHFPRTDCKEIDEGERYRLVLLDWGSLELFQYIRDEIQLERSVALRTANMTMVGICEGQFQTPHALQLRSFRGR